MDEKSENKRKYGRHEKTVKIHFAYDFTTKVDYHLADKKDHHILSRKHAALSKNISTEGLCFKSDQKLNTGDNLFMEVYLPQAEDPINLEGEVRWSRETNSLDKDEEVFDTGVKLSNCQGEPVHKSVHYDKQYHVYWSNVLEYIFGQVKTLGLKNNPAS